MIGTAGAIGIVATIGMAWLWFTPAGIPDRFEYLPAGIVTPVAPTGASTTSSDT